jgi:glutathione S-transferase
VKLYSRWLSDYARKIRIALREKGLEFEVLDVTTPERVDELYRLHPRGEVPLLLDGDLVVADSTLILLYLEDAYPDPSLLPLQPDLRVKARKLEDIADRHASPLAFALGEVFRRGHEDLKDRVLAGVREEADDLFRYLTQELGDGEWLCDRFSWPEISFFPALDILSFFDVRPRNYPKVTDWFQRCSERPILAQDAAEARAKVKLGIDDPELPLGHSYRQRDYRAERADFFLRHGMADYLRDGLSSGRTKCGIPLAGHHH